MVTLRRSHHRGAARRRSAGYTVMEVMMALAVLAVGATGVIAMQKATIIGNMHARNLSVANAVASTWIERLRADGLAWQRDLEDNSTADDSIYLTAVGTNYPTIDATEEVWFRPTPQDGLGHSPMADARGFDTTNVNTAAFCTNLRLTQLTDTLIRAEVRVFWLRTHKNSKSKGGTIGQDNPLCPDDDAYHKDMSKAEARGRYHFVYVSTGIIRNDSVVR